ncbi:14343_t:CDS:2 [Funneliformis geosporum]|uniref:14343_t:CDS:1 n=1 Tax=Funneliformis geosporum TaxID=1117311 RepID=A0A9W4T4Y0_9GLOM|nr:14343_t:CDS:2 [Funneliformis geosporum]
MENLLTSLDTFLDNTSITSLDDDDSFVQLYKSVTLQSIDIVYTSFYNNALRFSDVTIVMDTEEAILLLGELFANSLRKTANFTFAMVKWYDYYKSNWKYNEASEIYRCLRLSMLEDYNVIQLDSIA